MFRSLSSRSLLRYLAAATTVLAAGAIAQDELPPDASHMPDEEPAEEPGAASTGAKAPELPSWGGSPPVLRPRLWPGNPGSPAHPGTEFVPELQLPPEVDPRVIPHLFLPDYFGRMPDTLLVDPQTLLTAHERSAINRALDEHLARYKVPIFILLFQEEQDIPEFQSLQDVHATWFGDRPGIVVGFWLASPGRTAVEFGGAVRAEHPNGLEQAFNSAVSNSHTESYPFSQLDNFTFTFLWKLGQLEAPAAEMATAPPPSQTHEGKTAPELSDEPSPWIPIAAGGSALAIAAIGLGVFNSRRRRHRPYLLEERTPPARLGAPHSGGSGAVLQARSADQNSLPNPK